MTEEEKDLLIERYLTRELDEEEIAYVESLCKIDEDFNRNFHAQKIIRDTLKYGQVKANLDRIIEEYSLKESDKSGKVKYLKPWMAVAASLMLMLGFMGYAYQKLGWFNLSKPINEGEKIEIKDEPTLKEDSTEINKKILESPKVKKDSIHTKKEEIKSTAGINLEAFQQSLYINPNKFNQIATGSGVSFSIPSKSFVNNSNPGGLDSLEITYSQIINTKLLQPTNSNTTIVKVFKFSFSDEDLWSIKSLLPLEFSLEGLSPDDEVIVYYGGNKRQVGKWKKRLSSNLPLIEEPTSEMDQYKMYRKSIDLIDSVNTYYKTSGEYFIPIDKKGTKIYISFILDRLDYVKDYQSKTDFAYKIKLAEHLWEVYDAQRDIRVNQQIEGSLKQQMYITQPGWYAVAIKK